MAGDKAPLATVGDLRAAGVDVGPADEGRASHLLEMAAALVRAEAGEPDPDAGRIVCVAAVRRALGAAADGVTQQSQATGPFSASVTYANPSGDLYLTKAERRVLGCGRTRAASVSVTGGGPVRG